MKRHTSFSNFLINIIFHRTWQTAHARPSSARWRRWKGTRRGWSSSSTLSTRWRTARWPRWSRSRTLWELFLYCSLHCSLEYSPSSFSPLKLIQVNQSLIQQRRVSLNQQPASLWQREAQKSRARGLEKTYLPQSQGYFCQVNLFDSKVENTTANYDLQEPQHWKALQLLLGNFTHWLYPQASFLCISPSSSWGTATQGQSCCKDGQGGW